MKKYSRGSSAIDRTYRLTGNSTPLAYMLPVRHSRRYPLLWFDEDKRENRALRYAINQKTPFEDEQDGNALLEPVVFENGMLTVPRTNPVLQEFLYYHPLNGKAFEEVDKAKDAEEELSIYELENDAMSKARKLDATQMENVLRVLYGVDPSRMTSQEIKRDIYIYIRNNPKAFLEMLDDPDLDMDAKVREMFEKNLLAFRNNNKDIYINTPTNKKKLLTIPFGVDPADAAVSYFKTEEGIEILKHILSVMGN
jgi:hypothetical protein